MGALQALQEQRDLLWGEKPADLIVAVSGGSYLAASHALTANSIEDEDPPPLADGQPEAEWIASNPRYIFGGGVFKALWRLTTKFLLPGVVNVGALVSLFAWVGFFVADIAWVIERYAGWGSTYPILGVGPLGLVADAGAFAALAYFGTRLWYQEGARTQLGVLMLFAAFALTPSAIQAAQLSPIMSDPGIWLDSRWPVVVVLAIACLSILAATFARRVDFPLGRLALGALGLVSPWIPRILGLVVASLVATTWAEQIDRNLNDQHLTWFWAWFAGTLAAPLVIGALAGRLSLHRSYRSLLSRCFAIRRVSPSNVEDSRSTPLSGIVSSKAPRLVVAATANVFASRNGELTSYHPFAFSHDFCGIPGIAQALLPTERLELVWSVGKEPQVSLMTAVAATGAAVSPSMGRYTSGGLRPFLAAFNIRLGRWIANPLSEQTRNRVLNLSAPNWSSRTKRMGPALDELIQESLGLHSAGQATIYVSDGGHYDNLGILTALCARPAELWCVDASPDKKGLAGELRRVIDVVGVELPGTSIVVPDIDDFQVASGYSTRITATGTVTYPNGLTATLHICKLGLTTESSKYFKEYRAAERRFPFQSTVNQDYTAERFDAYRQLGYENMSKAAAPASTG